MKVRLVQEVTRRDSLAMFFCKEIDIPLVFPGLQFCLGEPGVCFDFDVHDWAWVEEDQLFEGWAITEDLDDASPVECDEHCSWMLEAGFQEGYPPLAQISSGQTTRSIASPAARG